MVAFRKTLWELPRLWPAPLAQPNTVKAVTEPPSNLSRLSRLPFILIKFSLDTVQRDGEYKSFRHIGGLHSIYRMRGFFDVGVGSLWL
jgi:hypothetical protein